MRPVNRIIYSFTGQSDGIAPDNLATGRDGKLYGTTGGGVYGPGTIFQLSPSSSANAPWTESVLHSFTGGADGSAPGRLVPGSNGMLFGAAFSGGVSNNGTVFVLLPPREKHGSWSFKVLYAFIGGSDGTGPILSGMYLNSNGSVALYGVTSGIAQGTVFLLTTPRIDSGIWRERTLYTFTGGVDGSYPLGILRNPEGFFGASLDNVFSLSLPSIAGGSWMETVLHTFGGSPDGDLGLNPLLLTKNGTLYGMTLGGGTFGNGTVYSLTPPVTGGEAWNERILYSFTGGSDGSQPLGTNLLIGPNGTLYGATEGGGTGCTDSFGCGVVFALSPPATANGPWTESVLYSFKGGNDGSIPVGPIVEGKDGTIYGTTNGGGTACSYPPGCGTVFAIKP